MNLIYEKTAAYIEYLKKQGYSVSLHIGRISFPEKLLSYGIHSNPYCLLIKSKKEAWDKCLECQKNVLKKCRKGNPFFGMCYAGVSEYVFPVGKDGWISVSGYRDNIPEAHRRIGELCKTYGFNENHLKSGYNKWLKDKASSYTELETLIYPLCAMTELMIRQHENKRPESETDTNADYIYAHAVLYIENNYREKITVDELSDYCHCSRSYLSHIFKKRNGKSINAYTNEIRLGKAAELLRETRFSMNEISERLGFSDSNYFTKLFKEKFGVPPTEYRRKE